MSLQTGGRAIGATSTRSRSASAASSRALLIGTMPTCSPSGPTRRTSGTRIRSLILGSELMGPPRSFCIDPAHSRHANGPGASTHGGRQGPTGHAVREHDNKPPAAWPSAWTGPGSLDGSAARVGHWWHPLAHPRVKRELVAMTGYQRGFE